jgi:ABC-type multidrug transport system permease subunit
MAPLTPARQMTMEYFFAPDALEMHDRIFSTYFVVVRIVGIWCPNTVDALKQVFLFVSFLILPPGVDGDFVF